LGKVIVITSGKGGVGKTTTTANIGTGLAALGQKVCLVDTDIGLRNLDVVMGLENRIVYDLLHVVEGQCRLRQALIKDKQFGDRLVLLPAPQTREKDAVTPEQMKELMKELREEYDFVLLDSPAGIEHGFKNAVAGADHAIVVTTPEIAAAAFSKAMWTHGTFHALNGKIVVETSRQPVALATRTGFSVDIRTCRTAIGSPQPGQRRWPPVRRTSRCDNCFRFAISYPPTPSGPGS